MHIPFAKKLFAIIRSASCPRANSKEEIFLFSHHLLATLVFRRVFRSKYNFIFFHFFLSSKSSSIAILFYKIVLQDGVIFIIQ